MLASIVDKQDNASMPINNNPKDSVVVVYNLLYELSDTCI
jgi:hypothetical protein